MLVAENCTVGPLLTTGEIVADRLTEPENPLRLVKVIFDLPELPCGMFSVV
jgi:hypothetical protein